MKLHLALFISLLLCFGMAYATDPWGNPGILTASMSLMTQVTLNGVPAASGDALGAFVTVSGNPQLRGKALVQVINGTAGCLIQIYTETNGETISFKVWDESLSMAFDASQTLPSEVNGIVGSWPNNLYQINASGTLPQVATPTFTPVAGTYTTARNVSISCATPGSQIRYTTNGTEPTASSAVYSTPINCPLNSTTTIKAKGFKTEWTPSATATGVYVITGTVTTPTF